MSPTVSTPFTSNVHFLIARIGRFHLPRATFWNESLTTSLFVQLSNIPTHSNLSSPVPRTSRRSKEQAILLRGEFERPQWGEFTNLLTCFAQDIYTLYDIFDKTGIEYYIFERKRDSLHQMEVKSCQKVDLLRPFVEISRRFPRMLFFSHSCPI